MTFAQDIQDDLDLATEDYPVTVDFVSRKQSGDVTDEGITALKRSVSKTDLVAVPVLTKQDGTVFNIKKADVQNEPKQNDQITETVSGTTWIVKSASVVTLGTRYRCVCTQTR